MSKPPVSPVPALSDRSLLPIMHSGVLRRPNSGGTIRGWCVRFLAEVKSLSEAMGAALGEPMRPGNCLSSVSPETASPFLRLYLR